MIIIGSSESICPIAPETSTLKLGQWLNLTLEVPCNITTVHWFTSGSPHPLDLRYMNEFGQGDVLQPNLGDVQCEEGRKNAHFRVRLTERAHNLLGGTVMALGYLLRSMDFDCVSFPAAKYKILDCEGKLQLYVLRVKRRWVCVWVGGVGK